ncbi:hypothetical protein, variant 1 [Aphanomyces astaci]|nr:hypothetical protein, variant 1 [Aphanomyces astaci]ETV72735.1 hypothetical protein, variant 1 [Aphanomyces astaci]|eukprot:XP_009837964.1 hypothetical protein, variant 1 [Aphanomyces astaci]
MANEIEKHDAIMQVFKDRELTQKQDAEHCIEVLNAKICDLHVRIESCSTLESVNDSLRLRVDELRRQLEDESKSHNDEIHAMRVDMFNHKMALEQTFRKSLQELDAQYLKKAFNAMADESKNALVANAKLKDELQMQSIGVENLMHRFKTQADQYHKMKVENEILEMGSSLRLKEISLLKASQHGIDRAVHNIKEEFAWKQSQVQSATTKLVEELKDEAKTLRSLYDQTQKRCQKWKSRYMALASSNQQLQQQQQHQRGVTQRTDEEDEEAGDPFHHHANFHSTRGSLEAGALKRRSKLHGDGFVAPPAMQGIDPKELWSASFAQDHDDACSNRSATAPLRPTKYDVNVPLKAIKPEPAIHTLVKLKKSHSQTTISRRPATTMR